MMFKLIFKLVVHDFEKSIFPKLTCKIINHNSANIIFNCNHQSLIVGLQN